MFGVTTSDDYQPVTWVGRYPVHVTTLLVGIHVVCAVATSLLFAFGLSGVLTHVSFDSALVLQRGEFWQLATYAFVHSPFTLIWFAIEMYMLFVFGREVERFIGSRAFILLYVLLLFAPTFLLSVWGFRERTGLAGSTALHLAIFVAFATIYPRVEMLLQIMAKWVALAVVGINTLMLLGGRAWPEIAVLWASVAVAFFFIRLRGIGPELVWWSNLKSRLQPRPKFQIVPKAAASRAAEPNDDVYESIDPLLEKISKHGINSLTLGERRALDRARARLLRETK
ncbi:MAG: rhomboid family intramembrane serine protease [Chthoniobacterales bacterium]